jgi:hypothetical protein
MIRRPMSGDGSHPREDQARFTSCTGHLPAPREVLIRIRFLHMINDKDLYRIHC